MYAQTCSGPTFRRSIDGSPAAATRSPAPTRPPVRPRPPNQPLLSISLLSHIRVPATLIRPLTGIITQEVLLLLPVTAGGNHIEYSRSESYSEPDDGNHSNPAARQSASGDASALDQPGEENAAAAVQPATEGNKHIDCCSSDSESESDEDD